MNAKGAELIRFVHGEVDGKSGAVEAEDRSAQKTGGDGAGGEPVEF